MDEESDVQSPMINPISGNSITKGHEDDDRIRKRLLNGEYKIIIQLLGVLENGQLAKKLTDTAIDRCEQLQNLRKAIYDYRRRLEGMAIGTAKVGVDCPYYNYY